MSSTPRGYFLTNRVSHTRFFPLVHTFKYTTVAVLVELQALEDHELNIWSLFGYNKRWRAICALRPNDYLFSSPKNSEMSISQKLEALVRREGYAGIVDDGKYEAWMLTMPSYFGFEGINPLTVYFLYKSEDLALVVLEVHNTFGETHIYFMRPGVEEESLSVLQCIYDHRWTFPRAFHVSPFNDRKGFYTVSIKLPTIPEDPKPVVIIQLREPDVNSTPGNTKITAILRTTSALPLVSSLSAVRDVLFTLMLLPLSLFLSFSRILYQAWVLHYRKRNMENDHYDLKVYLRPEPFLPVPAYTSPPPGNEMKTRLFPAAGAGITTRRLSSGFFASRARQYVKEFLRTRVELEDGKLGVVLVEPEALGDQEEWFLPSDWKEEAGRTLRITLLTPVFFELLLTAPGPGLVLLAGGVIDPSKVEGRPTIYSTILDTDRGPNDIMFIVNDAKLFVEVFDYTLPTFSPIVSRVSSFLQTLRRSALPTFLVEGENNEQDTASKVEIMNHLLSIPDGHFLDSTLHKISPVEQALSSLQLIGFLTSLLALAALEPHIFSLFRARVKSGTETWYRKIWERTEQRVRAIKALASFD
ncbi:hypothetical protein D9757_004910 [Collybiopsis confluens]|uniref:Uncharacterized protein n=1 Tax=Collybiopsis confluens TaxID=2823264 RepID=A0A8H5HT78_9AGAR|nr:hypothetical protein D9757_004910 [Collybiopsis confluens]